MTDYRPICYRCECSMVCKRNGVIIKYSENTRQDGDLYECPICRHKIVTGFGRKYESKAKWDVRREIE